MKTIVSAVKFCILCVAVSTLFAACGGKTEVKQASPDSRISMEAFEAVEAIRAAYVRKDYTPIAERTTKEGYKQIVDSIKYFDSVELVFTPRWVEIEQAKVHLNVSWKGNWTVGKETIKERGMAVFLFEGRPLKVSKIVRGNPFQYPER